MWVWKYKFETLLHIYWKIITDVSKQPTVFIMTVLGLNDRKDKIIMSIRKDADSIRHQHFCDNFHSAQYILLRHLFAFLDNIDKRF